jgi:hypothetical protein
MFLEHHHVYSLWQASSANLEGGTSNIVRHLLNVQLLALTLLIVALKAQST